MRDKYSVNNSGDVFCLFALCTSAAGLPRFMPCPTACPQWTALRAVRAAGVLLSVVCLLYYNKRDLEPLLNFEGQI